MLAARLVLSEYWVLTVTAAFGQRKRKLQKIEKRENSHKKENSNMITAQTTTRLSFSKVRRARVKKSIAKILKRAAFIFQTNKKRINMIKLLSSLQLPRFWPKELIPISILSGN